MYAFGKLPLEVATSGYTPAFCMDFRAGENITWLKAICLHYALHISEEL